MIVKGRRFEMQRDLIDVTSISRVDPSWQFTDAAGHLHQWFVGDKPAENYNPSAHYEVPTIHTVDDGTYWCEDCRDEHNSSHWECNQCGAAVSPGTCADSWTQYIAGLSRFRIDGVEVTGDEFKAEYERAIA